MTINSQEFQSLLMSQTEFYSSLLFLLLLLIVNWIHGIFSFPLLHFPIDSAQF